MATCETCGNEYDKLISVTVGDGPHLFDSFECAIQALAPSCERCGVRIVGHGVESEDRFYCSAHCAHEDGIAVVRDRV